MRPAIRVENLSKRYGDVVAVDDLSFEVRAGSTTALLGANGAGKTTTIAMILGLLAASAGRITVLGEEVPPPCRDARADEFLLALCRLACALERTADLLVYADLYRVERPRERIRALSADLDLQDLLDRPTGQLSSGQKTRLMLAKALINRPGLLLLDEPTPRSIRTPRTSSAATSSAISTSTPPRCCSRRTIWPRSSACARTC